MRASRFDMRSIFVIGLPLLALGTCAAHCNESCPKSPERAIESQLVTATGRVVVDTSPVDDGELHVRPTRLLGVFVGLPAELRAMSTSCMPTGGGSADLLRPSEDRIVHTRPGGAVLLVPACGDGEEAALPWSATLSYSSPALPRWINEPIHGQCVPNNTVNGSKLYVEERP